MGWREYLDIPELQIEAIKAKIDTGARTSAIHVTNLKILKKGKSFFAEFNVHPKQNSAKPTFHNRCKIFKFKTVKSSNGISSERPTIKTTVVIGDISKEIELTLVNRDLMGFRLLLGRTALRSDFIIDPGKSYLASSKPKVKPKVKVKKIKGGRK